MAAAAAARGSQTHRVTIDTADHDSDESEEEEKTSPERISAVRMRGRYSRARMAELGIVFSSSELGMGPNFSFDVEAADPVRGIHTHRMPLSAPARAAKAQDGDEDDEDESGDMTFLTEAGMSPHGSPTSRSSDSNHAIAETTCRTIWQMWKRMKHHRAKQIQTELSNESIPLTRKISKRRSSGGSTAGGGGSEADAFGIDYVAAGRHIASQLARSGVKVSHNHLDVIHNLAGLEKVWLSSRDGLDEGEFVRFLEGALRLPADELRVLFQKMDANADGALSWDEYLSYLLIEVGHHWQFRAAKGTFHLREIDQPAKSVGGGGSGSGSGSVSGVCGSAGADAGVGGGPQVQVTQIAVVPAQDGNDALSRAGRAAQSNVNAPKYILSCRHGREQMIQIWNASTLTYQCHLPAPWTNRKGIGSQHHGHVGSDASASPRFHPPPHHHAHRVGGVRRFAPSGGGMDGGALRPRRAGGGGWKEESTNPLATFRSRIHASSQHTSSVEEMVARRMGRINMFDSSSTTGATASIAGDDSSSVLTDGPPSMLGASSVYGRTSSTSSSSHHPSHVLIPHTTVAYYPTSKQILVASMDKTIHFYAQNGSRTFVQVDRMETQGTPQCMDVFVGSARRGGQSIASTMHGGSGSGSSGGGLLSNDLLIVGDTSGRCNAYRLPLSRYDDSEVVEKHPSMRVGGLADRRHHESYVSSTSVGMPATMSSSALFSPYSLSTNPTHTPRACSSFQAHAFGESVRKVSLVPSVGLLSVGMDCLLNISDLESAQVVRSLRGHKRGVYSFAHCESYRCTFTVGFDSRILVWDPYLPTPTGSLPGLGGCANILDVVVNERKNQILTATSDRKIKVYDIRTLQCIYTTMDNTSMDARGEGMVASAFGSLTKRTPLARRMRGGEEEELSAIAFDTDLQQLITAGTGIRAWPVMIAPGNQARRGGPAHRNLIVAICYSAVFQQIISVSVDETVHLHDIYTGKSVFEFRTNHGSPITAACLDHRGKRLLTAAHDGSCLMWNFNNGARMHEFKSRNKEVTALLYLPRTLQCVVGIGLDRSVIRWPDPSSPKGTPCLVQHEHHERSEVGAMAFHESMLVTGASDGEIIAWYVDSARVNKRFNIPITPRTSKRPGITKLLFIDFPFGLVLLVAGTDDGSIHFMKLSTCSTVFSLFEVFPEPVVCMAVNRVTDGTSNTEGGRSRLMVADCQADAKLFDLSGVKDDEDAPIADLPVLRSWEPHPGGTTTDVISLELISAFASASDMGDITLWSSVDGKFIAKFGQRKSWPIHDPRQASRLTQHRTKEEEEIERRAERRAADESSESEMTPSSPSSSSSSSEAEEANSHRPSRVGSRVSTSRHHRHRPSVASISTSGVGVGVGVDSNDSPFDGLPTPLSSSHDDCARYIQEYQQHLALENRERERREREAREEEIARRKEVAARNAANRKLPLADMLHRLENDLKHQHERALQPRTHASSSIARSRHHHYTHSSPISSRRASAIHSSTSRSQRSLAGSAARSATDSVADRIQRGRQLHIRISDDERQMQMDVDGMHSARSTKSARPSISFSHAHMRDNGSGSGNGMNINLPLHSGSMSARASALDHPSRRRVSFPNVNALSSRSVHTNNSRGLAPKASPLTLHA